MIVDTRIGRHHSRMEAKIACHSPAIAKRFNTETVNAVVHEELEVPCKGQLLWWPSSSTSMS